ncbi:FtsX-like permease family protein [Streptomyces sp. NPDC050256]|uniref:FtsX-like permease family protein n=1 Tax=Streptomyces sp. NPDC050256 TaxID=3365607 RepID=UPI00379CE987
MIAGQLRQQAVRTLTMLLGVLVATSGFLLLTGSVETSRLRVEDTANRNFRTAYDILVRPGDAISARERASASVRPNFMAGQFGGISTRQWKTVTGISGVEVSAPIAMLGYSQVTPRTDVDITGQVDRSADRQLLRVRTTWSGDRGLSRAEDPGYTYVYVTKHPLIAPRMKRLPGEDSYELLHEYWDGGKKLDIPWDVCGGPTRPLLEKQERGRPLALCPLEEQGESDDRTTARGRDRLVVFRLNPDGTFTGTGSKEVDRPKTASRARVQLDWPMSMLVAAVDPVQEARLAGLDGATVSGRYFRDGEQPVVRKKSLTAAEVVTPLLVAADPQTDEQLTARVDRLGGGAARLPGMKADRAAASLPALPARPAAEVRREAGTVYRESVVRGDDSFAVDLNTLIQTGPVSYGPGPAPLRPVPSTDGAAAWRDWNSGGGPAPSWFVHDTGFRPMTSMGRTSDAGVWNFPSRIGTFDPAKLTGAAGQAAAPLETYQPAHAAGADAASRRRLGDRSWLPDNNPAGYLATPPQVLTPLSSLTYLLAPDDPQAAAPISAVRVRVAGVTGMDDASRERIRRVAEQIAVRTGLTVDITAGASPAPRDVRVAAGEFGRPELSISEYWTVKGVAVALVHAVDRKSVLLFALVLVVCALFLVNAVSASVRTRRRELAVLSCVGWPGRRLAALVLGEVGLIALAAGVLGAAAAFPLGALCGLDVSAARALTAVPLVVGLALAAGAGPAVRAGRAHPSQALHPPVHAGRRARRRRSVAGMAASNVVRVPSRSLLGVLALAFGVAAVTMLAAVMWAFHGSAQGTLLGDAVSVSVRGVDVAAGILTAALGAFALADVVYLNVRERDAELAALCATGWSDGELTRLIATEGALLGLAGSVLGAGAGLAATGVFVGTVTGEVAAAAAAVAGCGLLLAVAVSLVPARLVRDAPLAALLSQE